MPRPAQKTVRTSWPPEGTAHYELLDLLDRLREEQPVRPSTRVIAATMKNDCPTSFQTVDRYLRGALLMDTRMAVALVRALGGSSEDVDTARRCVEAMARAPGRPRRATAAPPRVLAPARAALAPQILHAMPRLPTVERTLLRRPRPDPGGDVVFLAGEGGLGKSVLLGQVLARFDEFDAVWPWSCAVLVSCADVELLGPQSPGSDALDHAFAAAAGKRAGESLVALLTAMRAQHGAPLLLVDTLDLLLTDATFHGIAGFLARAASISDVLVTCRDHEYKRYFGNVRGAAPRLYEHVRDVTVPPLNGAEILEWTRAYLTHRGGAPDTAHRAFLDSLSEGVGRSSTLRRVCAVPVRLALTCDLFSAEGRVPEHLTVTGLYSRYWAERICRPPQKEDAALAAAARVVADDGDILLRVPRLAIAAGHREGTELLASEGVLRDHGTGWEFFHQTFAEFAHARWLLMQPYGAPALTALIDWVRAGRRNLWPVVRSLLLQADGADHFHRLVTSIPADDPEGAAVRQLRNPPASSGQERVAALVGPAATALGTLLPRYGSAQQPERLADALGALLAVKPVVPTHAWEHHAAKLFDGFTTSGLPAAVLREVWDRYGRLEAFVRRAALQVLLADPRSADTVTAATRAALARACPPLDDDEQRRVLELAWNSSTVREDRGWNDWRDLIADPLPNGWINAQMLLLERWADQDTDVLDGILTDLLDGRVAVDKDPAGRLTAAKVLSTVLSRIVQRHAERVVSRLLAAAPPADSLGFGVIADCAPAFAAALDQDGRRALLGWLDRADNVPPRRAWPVRVVLAGDDIDLHRALVAELGRHELPPAVTRSAVDTWLHNSPRPVLVELAPELRNLLVAEERRARQARLESGGKRPPGDHRARLEGILAVDDAEARAWITNRLLGEHERASDRKAVKQVLAMLAPGPVDAATAQWLAELLMTPHTDAAQRVAAKIADQAFLPDPLPSAVSAPPIIERIRRAVERGEDAVLIENLVEVLIRVDGARPLTVAQVEEVFGLNRARLPENLATLETGATADHSAAVRQAVRLVGTLLARRLGDVRAWELFSMEILTDLEPVDLGEKLKKSISSAMVGLFHRDPRTLDRAYDLFAAERTRDGVRWAVAEAMLVVDRMHGSERAARLRNDPRCPRTVTAHLMAAHPNEW